MVIETDSQAGPTDSCQYCSGRVVIVEDDSSQNLPRTVLSSRVVWETGGGGSGRGGKRGRRGGGGRGGLRGGGGGSRTYKMCCKLLSYHVSPLDNQLRMKYYKPSPELHVWAVCRK